MSGGSLSGLTGLMMFEQLLTWQTIANRNEPPATEARPVYDLHTVPTSSYFACHGILFKSGTVHYFVRYSVHKTMQQTHMLSKYIEEGGGEDRTGQLTEERGEGQTVKPAGERAAPLRQTDNLIRLILRRKPQLLRSSPAATSR
ncbi:uncharacterized protein V6R79_016344 [Siganus canaliculatus]